MSESEIIVGVDGTLSRACTRPPEPDMVAVHVHYFDRESEWLFGCWTLEEALLEAASCHNFYMAFVTQTELA